MKPKRRFHCVECGGDVVDTTGPRRRALYRLGVELPVPESFVLPTCTACGETYLTAEQGTKLSKLQGAAYDVWLTTRARGLIELLRGRHETTLAHLAGACGVTPTLFSKIMSGKKTSLTLVRLLESFVAAPSELRRHLEGRPLAVEADAAAIVVASSKTMAFGWSSTAPGAQPHKLTIEYERADDTLPLAAPSNDVLAA